MKKDYFAFISYKSEDVEWATWLQHELEHYHLPASFNGRTDVPQELRPVFRDIDELSAGNLPEQIKQALANSLNLIVICSPQAAESPWVNQEVETFISLGKTGRIFPFIVEGNSPSEYFPPALLMLPKDEERLGGDVSKKGRDAAFVKVVAGMLGVGFDSLWNRYEKEKAAEERKIREQRDNLLRLQSRFVAEKVNTLVDEGDSYTAQLLALMALPKDINNPERPYVPEAESALRKANLYETAILRGHTKTVNFSAFSPDGGKIVSASVDGTIRIWDSMTGKELMKLTETGSVYTATFSPNGEQVVSVSWPETVRIWNALTGRELMTLKGHTKGVKYAAFNPDGKQIITVSNNVFGNNIKIWDTQTGQEIRELRGHTVAVNFASFSPDGKRIIAASGDKTITIWDTQTGEELRKYEQFENVDSVTFSPDGNRIVSISNSLFGHTVQIWDAYTGQGLKELKGHTKVINSAVFSPNGKYIVSASDDGTVRIWDSRTGEQIGDVLKGHTAKVEYATFSPNGRQIVSASEDKTIRIWDAHPGVETKIHEGSPAAFNPDGNRIVSASNEQLFTIRKWDVRTGQETWKLEEHVSEVRSADISLDSKIIVSSSWDNIITKVSQVMAHLHNLT